MTSIVAAKFYTTHQKNGFLALNSAAATSLGSKCEVKQHSIVCDSGYKIGPQYLHVELDVSKCCRHCGCFKML